MKIREKIEIVVRKEFADDLKTYLDQSFIGPVQIEYVNESMHNGPQYKVTIPPGLESLDHVVTMVFFAGIKLGMK
jgi:hypothetical protein